jgi:RHS repeat-associated protein
VVRTRPEANQTNPSVTTATTSQYDALGRVISVNYSNSNSNLYFTPSKTLTYDTLSNLSWPLPLGSSKGRLVLATTGAATTQIGGYDALGNAGNTVQCLPGWCGQSNHDVMRWYEYNSASQETSEQYLEQASSGTAVSVNLQRNVAGQVTSLSGGQSSTSQSSSCSTSSALFSANQYGPFGLTAGTYGNNLGLAISYDGEGRVSGGSVCTSGVSSPGCSGSSTMYAFTSGWTGSYLTSASDTVLNASASVGYDNLGRLASANVDSGLLEFSYQYDRWGNRVNQSASGSGSGSAPQPSLSFNTGNNQLTGVVTYDAAGNVTWDGIHSYTYDAEGNVVGVDGNTGVQGAAQYVFDAFNHRVETVSESGTVLRYAYNLNGLRASTWNANGSLQTANYYADGLPVAYWSAADGNLHYIHQDWLGTVRMRTTQAGGVDGTYFSYPFGDGFAVSGNDSDPQHYALLDHDADSWTEHAQNRQYNSTPGRWMSPDPYSGSYDLSNPQSLNRYAYVMNNPLSSTDPNGLDGTSAPACVVAVSSGGAAAGADAWCVGGLAVDALLGSLINRLFDYHPLTIHPSPDGTSSPNWDGNFGESLGISTKLPLPGGGIAAALGLPNAGCEFGACGGIATPYASGAVTAPIGWCVEHPTTCTLGEDAVQFLKAFPALLASTMALSMEGDSDRTDQDHMKECGDRYFAEQDRCTQRFGSGGRFGSNRAKGACLDRAFYRYTACISNQPDPGPPMATLHPLPAQGLSPELLSLVETPINSELIRGKTQ